MKQIVAISIVVLIASISTTVALPEDLLGYDTPAERKAYWQDQITNFWQHLERCGIEGKAVWPYLYDYYLHAMEELEEYIYMYEIVSSQELTTSDVPIYGNCSA